MNAGSAGNSTVDMGSQKRGIRLGNCQINCAVVMFLYSYPLDVTNLIRLPVCSSQIWETNKYCIFAYALDDFYGDSCNAVGSDILIDICLGLLLFTWLCN